jgi:hypothetical protein
MRRAILGVFFLVAACGGDARKSDAVDQSPGAVDHGERARYVTSAEGQALIASFAKFHSQDALDTCVAAWIDDSDTGQIAGDPVRKPNGILLRLFLSECLGGSTPADARMDGANGARADRGSVSPGLRRDQSNDARGTYNR